MALGNKRCPAGICFPMKTVYYMTVAGNTGKRSKEYTQVSFRKSKEPLSVYRCSRSYLFAEGPPSAAGNPVGSGELQIYFSFLPENFFKDMKKAGRRKGWIRKISGTLDFVESILQGSGGLSVLFSEELCELLQRKQEIPAELYGVLLFNRRKERKFRRISISMPDEYGSLLTENVIGLIEPYLAGTEAVTFTGTESERTWDLEDYLYDEYGIVMCYERYPAEDSLWLDFGRRSGMSFLREASGKEIYHINDERIMKFLDTIVKSGYNTKVN